jgi:hydrogenase-4 component B
MVTMLLGALLALLSNDLKRVLASSSLSQIGFILIRAGLMTLLEGDNGLAASERSAIW